MDQFLRNFIYKPIKLGKISVSVLDLLLLVCVSGTGVLLREAVIDYTPVTGSKLLAVVLDYVCAVLGAAFIYSRTHSKLRAYLTYALMVIWPIFAANSALLDKKGSLCGILLILALLAFDKGMKYLSAASAITALAIGIRGIQVPADPETLTLGWPNIFELTGKIAFLDLYDKVSLLFIAGILLCIVYCIKQLKIKLTKELILPMLLFLAIFLPFFVAFMPAWAGYGADVLAVLFAVLVPKKFYVAMLHVIVSYSAYANTLNGETKLPMALFGGILLFLLLDVGAYVYQIMRKNVLK